MSKSGSLLNAIVPLADVPALLRAFERYCTCQFDDGGLRVGDDCAGCAMLTATTSLAHLVFERNLRERLENEEHGPQKPPVLIAWRQGEAA